MEWEDDPQDRAPMTEALKTIDQLRARNEALEAEVLQEQGFKEQAYAANEALEAKLAEARKLLSTRVEADRLSEVNTKLAALVEAVLSLKMPKEEWEKLEAALAAAKEVPRES